MRKTGFQLRAHVMALGVYILLALIVTFPLPLYLGQRIIANEPGQVDGYLGIWNIWWTATALSNGQDPFISPLLFYPQGLDLFWQTLSLPQGILALPFTLTIGPLPAYNLLILAGFVLGGYFAFLLIRAILRSDSHLEVIPAIDLAALIGGAVYAFAPFHMQKVLDAQLEVAAIQWLPLWAWAMLVLLERRRLWYVLLAAAALLWVGLGTWYYGLFALIASGAMAVFWAVDRRIHNPGAMEQPGREQPSHPTPRNLRLSTFRFRFSLSTFLWGMAPIAIWFALMAPRLIDLAQRGDTLLGDARLQQTDAVADLISFWMPNPNHPLWGGFLSEWYQSRYPEAILWNVSLGLVGTLLGVLGLILAWRRQWRWALLGTVAAIFALGAELHAFGVVTDIPLPYAVIRDLPGVRSSHRPNHFVLITILTTAIFAAYGMLALVRRIPQYKGPIAASVLAMILLIDGWAGPLPLYQRPMPQPYLSFPTPDGALLPVPLHLNFSNSENLWYQTAHRWPIVGGFIGREPPYPIARYLPGIHALRFGNYEPNDILSPGWPELARESLAVYDIRYVMFHKEAMGSSLPLMTDLIAAMGLRPSYNDDLIGVYPVPEPAELRPLAYLGAGWGNLEREGDRRWRWMGERAVIYLINPDDQPRAIRLDLDLEAFEQSRPLRIGIGNGARLRST